MRKAYGGAYLAMCAKSLGADRVAAWPTAEIAVMGPEGAVSVLYKDDIKNNADPKAKRAELIEKYSEYTFQDVSVNEGIFYESILTSQGAIYKKIQTFKMNAEI